MLPGSQLRADATPATPLVQALASRRGVSVAPVVSAPGSGRPGGAGGARPQHHDRVGGADHPPGGRDRVRRHGGLHDRLTISHAINVGVQTLSLLTAGPLAVGNGAALTLQAPSITVGFARLDAGSGGQIVFNGNTSLGPTTFLALALTPAQANGPSLIVVNGTLNLGGAFLAFSGPGGIPAGSRFTAISNVGGDTIVGNFAQGGGDTVAGDLYLFNTSDGNDAVLSRPFPIPPVRKVTVALVTKGRAKIKTLFLDATFTDNGELKTEIKSPFQAPQFKMIRFTLRRPTRTATA